MLVFFLASAAQPGSRQLLFGSAPELLGRGAISYTARNAPLPNAPWPKIELHGTGAEIVIKLAQSAPTVLGAEAEVPGWTRIGVKLAGIQLALHPLIEPKRSLLGHTLSTFVTAIAPDGDGAALCEKLYEDGRVALCYLAPTEVDAHAGAYATEEGSTRRELSESNSYVHLQGYRLTAEDGGLGFDHEAVKKYDGTGINIADIEYSWNADHEDLPPIAVGYGQPYDYYGNNHGTAVWGEIVSKSDNGFGTSGLVPQATPFMFYPHGKDGKFSVAAAIYAAADSLVPGDVILIEQQTVCLDVYAPVSCYAAEYEAIRYATDAGIVVIEAAANGGLDLDDPQLNGIFDREARDSGAIMVGGGRAADRSYIGSSYGARVDMHAWYDWTVATTGYGDLSAADDNTMYTDSFSGTSSASPLVASAAVALQQAAKDQLGRVLSPVEVRELLVHTGQPQKADALGRNVGPLPNIHAAIERLKDDDVASCVAAGGECYSDLYCCDRDRQDFVGCHAGVLQGAPSLSRGVAGTCCTTDTDSRRCRRASKRAALADTLHG